METLTLAGCTPETIRELIERLGEKSFRAKQILEWIYVHHAPDIDAMSTLSVPLRERLKQTCRLYAGTVETLQRSRDASVKLLIRYDDSAAAETVLMPRGKNPSQRVCVQSGRMPGGLCVLRFGARGAAAVVYRGGNCRTGAACRDATT